VRLRLLLTSLTAKQAVHPFFRELIAAMFDAGHYGRALKMLADCTNLINSLGRDYMRLLKFADSLERAKLLKRAALTRMCSAVLAHAPVLCYLEDVRNHLAQLPVIDTSLRAIIVCGSRGVGKVRSVLQTPDLGVSR
jgi:nucleolar GTP-binding protein